MDGVNEGGTLPTVTRCVGRNLSRSAARVRYDKVQTVAELRSLDELHPPWQHFLEVVEAHLRFLQKGRHHQCGEGWETVQVDVHM